MIGDTASTVRAWANAVRQRLNAEHANPNSSSSGLSGWLNSLVNHFNHAILSPINAFTRTVVDWTHVGVYWMNHLREAVGNLTAWFINGQLKWLKGFIQIQVNRLQAEIKLQHSEFVRRLNEGLKIVSGRAHEWVRLESTYRHQADIALDSEIKTRIKWLHQNIEREAISGYQLGAKDRAGVVTDVAGLIAKFAPETKFLVREVVRGILDLLEVDNPVLRIALGFVLRHIVKHLGLDKPVGHLLGRLMGTVLATGKPKGLHDVVYDITGRLSALEGQWAEFMADGGSEILQAGKEWQAITSLTTDAALIAFVGLMAAKPDHFASELAGTAGVVVNDTIKAVGHFIERVV